MIINKGNSSISLLNNHKSINRKQFVSQTIPEGTTLTIRRKQRYNRKPELQPKTMKEGRKT